MTTLSEIRARIQSAPTSSAGDPPWLKDAKFLLDRLETSRTARDDWLERYVQARELLKNRSEYIAALKAEIANLNAALDVQDKPVAWSCGGRCTHSAEEVGEWRRQGYTPDALYAATPLALDAWGELDRFWIGATEYIKADMAVRQIMALQSENAKLCADARGEPVAWLCGDDVTISPTYADWLIRNGHKAEGLFKAPPTTDREKRLVEALEKIAATETPYLSDVSQRRTMVRIARDAVEAYING